DHLDTETLQARLAGRLHMLRPAIDRIGTTGPLDLAELGRQHHLVAPAAGERLAEQRFIVTPAIHVGAVEEIDATVDRVVDDPDALGIVALAVNARYRHAAEPDREDAKRAAAELAWPLRDSDGHGDPRVGRKLTQRPS